MLNVQSRKHINLRGENFLYILVALPVFAAGYIRVRKLIHQNDGGASSNDRVHIHLFKNGAFILQFAAGNSFELRAQFLDAFTAMCFDEADHHIFTAVVAADAFAQHAICLANTRRVAEKELEDAFGSLLGCGFLEPVFGPFWHLTSSPAAWRELR